MVVSQGKPIQHRMPDWLDTVLKSAEAKFIDSDLIPTQDLFNPRLDHYGRPEYKDKMSIKEWVNLFQHCVLQRAVPRFKRAQSTLNEHSPEMLDLKRFQANVLACQEAVAIGDLKNYVKNKKRITIEQAAALIVSFAGVEHAAKLIPHLRDIILRSCMWLLPTDISDGRTIEDEKYERLMGKVNRIFKHYEMPEVPLGAHQQLYDQMLRCRRKSNKGQCFGLRIPAWLCTFVNQDPDDSAHAGIEKAESFTWPERPMDASSVVLGKHQFRILERLAFRQNGPQDAATYLRKAIDSLYDDSVTGGVSGALEATADPVALSFSFLALQRSIQRTVVSDSSWTGFLEKGESTKVSQNSYRNLSSFELALAHIAVNRPESEIDYKTLTAVQVPPGLEHLANSKYSYIMWGLDQCCLLMEEFVRVHGQGKFENLTFKRGVKGDSRGAVDQYNALVDILVSFKKLYKDYNETDSSGQRFMAPGECHKFLAKDIMHWNNAWKDDAFADGKRPGWVEWLANRRHAGALKQPEFPVS
jgi:hypothetical protein